jgi:hypothetical protein
VFGLGDPNVEEGLQMREAMIEVRPIQRAQDLILLRFVAGLEILGRHWVKRKSRNLQCLLSVHYYYQLHHFYDPNPNPSSGRAYNGIESVGE